ncbi:farnesyl-diphosphate synthase [Pontibacillus halophilus JSM 076056 = DSM 19796]|uniref:Farnesyl diphosphate synthase n=1 Tax=Pontibacillus halophilus JSM 076056 = DSM 19796 TaxID=1385510 RepID=A0A0A5GFX3_9BACI|nr:farnesyl diphosphate synthase [Pontibacillus halophilus]KGX90914.1 farnesyl-diphosphate synthase [Pontibacillus halophilus JSM 076056 = DSM 19796]
MKETLATFIQNHVVQLNSELEASIRKRAIPDRLKESMLYSIKAGGKRIRPMLMLAANDAFGGTPERVMPVASAVEMIHTYSLVHDDLPAMDDDDVRRGQPTNHKQFDEATAILAGDGLLTTAFHLISQSSLTDGEKGFILKEMAQASGAEGMVAGQMLDMEAEGEELTLEELENIHRLKTGELLRFSVLAGAYLGGANVEQREAIERYAKALGLLFQVQDDILDVVGNADELGKPIGSDVGNDKSTYPQLLGLEGAKEQKEIYARKAKDALVEAGVESTLLEDFVDYINDRTA